MNTSVFHLQNAPFRGLKEGLSKAQRREEHVVNDVEMTKNIRSSKIWPQEISFVARRLYFS